MIIVDAIQGSDEWLNARLGRATASCFSDVLAKGEGITRKKYLRRLVAERLTGKPQNGWAGNADTERGSIQEPYARMAYEALTGNMVQEVGFCQLELLMAGASPDGLINVKGGANGGLEIKSVIPTVQLETIERGGCPPCHIPQVQGNLWITGREWWDFISWSPDMPENLRLYRFTVERDEAYISKLNEEVSKFLSEVSITHEKLMEWKTS